MISVERVQPGLAVVVLEGEHESYASPKLETQLESLLSDGVAVVVDLSRTTFTDSTTLLVLLKTRREAEERGLGFVLQMDVSTGEYVYRIFELTRLTSVFSIFHTRAEALEAARSRRPAPQREAEAT